MIDFVTDASKHKIGKLTPNKNTIHSDNIFKKKKIKFVAIILSWNISGLLKKS